MARSPNLIKVNFNPWKQHIGDCAIRAVSAATGLDYRAVCNKLKVAWKNGRGLVRNGGIDLRDIEKAFDEYFDVVEDYYDNYEFVPDEMKGSAEDAAMQAYDDANGITAVSQMTLDEFIGTMFAGPGTFLVSLAKGTGSSEKGVEDGGHIVCARCSKDTKKRGFVDTWDSGGMYVDAYMRVAKKEPKDSPLHWKYDYATKQFIV